MRQRLKQKYDEVSLPESGVSVKKVGKYYYAYHIGKGYRNAKGQPTNDKTGIGRVDKGTGKLTPNENYFAIYGGEPSVKVEIDSVLNFGHYYLLQGISKETGLTKVLQNVFGDKGEQILLLATYMALTGDATYRCEGWSRETLTGSDRVLASSQISRLFTQIDERQRMDFFRAWVHVRQQKEYIAYDVTSMSSYARGNEAVEYGYNRDKESLPQVNYGMYYGEESRMPIFYCMYKGSVVDKSELPYMMQYNDILGIKDVSFVLDRGFYTEENITGLAHKHRYIIGIGNGLKLSKEIIARHGAEVTSSEYDIGDMETTGMAIEDDRYGFRCKIMLYHSYEKRLGESNIFKSKLKRWEKELLEGKTVQAANDYFAVTSEGEGEDKIIKVARNHKAIDEQLHNMGFFLMLTTDLKRTPAEVLDIYRMKDVVETCFDDLKNGIDMKRLRVHSEEAMEGKAFVAFIALILRSFVHNKLKDYLAQKRLSLAQAFDELRMIKAVKIRNGMLLCNPITKKQRTILSFFGKDGQSIIDELNKFDSASQYYD